MEMIEKLAALKYWGFIASCCILGVSLAVWSVTIVREARKKKSETPKRGRRRYIDASTLEDKIWEMIEYVSTQKDDLYYKGEINALRTVLRMITTIEGRVK